MKCDELETEQWLDYGGEPMPCYPAKDVDAAIDELKAENKSLKEDLYKTDHHNIQYLCRMYGCDNVEAFHGEIKNLQTKLIATERALWLARAERAKTTQLLLKNAINHLESKYKHRFDNMRLQFHVWGVIKRKCLKKEEEYR